MDRQSIGGHREAASEWNRNGTFGHPTWNAFALLHPMSWLLNDQTFRRVTTRSGPVPRILEDMGVAVKISRLSHR